MGATRPGRRRRRPSGNVRQCGRESLPRVFGGDTQAGERLLRRAVALDPHDPIRLMLAQVLHAAGEGEEASANAAIAFSIFERMGPASEVAAARSVLAGLH